MTITDVSLTWSGSTGGVDTDDGKTFRVSLSQVYDVVHTADATEAEILADNRLPTVAVSTFPGFDYVWCKRKNITQRKGPILSQVTANYSGEVGPSGSDPTESPPKIKYRNIKVMADADVDARGVPITTVVGEPVDGIQRQINDWQLTVERKYAAVDTQAVHAYLDSTNADSFHVLGDTWAPGTASMTDYNVEPVFSNEESYFLVRCVIEFRKAYNTVPARAWWHRYRHEGNYVRYGTRVSFTGGGGTGASGYAIASGGAVTSVQIMCRGHGYTSAPSVSFESDTGGSGATATAVLDGDEVSSVSVGAGGSDYKTGVERAVDKNKEPTTKPVLLKANGAMEPDPNNAFWCERPSKQFYLPYTSLGLMDL